MISEACLFCNESEQKDKSELAKDFICSGCVQLLLSTDQADLKQAHSKAIKEGYPNKATAIESFIIPGNINDRETKNAKRGMVRKRPMRTARPARNQLRPQPPAF